MKKVMFVCHGNICRSPMAEFVFKMLVRERGLADEIFAASSATSTEEIWRGRGSPIHPSAVRMLSSHGVPFSQREATLLLPSDLEKYDLFVGMDEANIRGIHRILGKRAQGRVQKLLSRDVADPWYTGDFEEAYSDIYEGCSRLLDDLCADEDNMEGKKKK